MIKGKPKLRTNKNRPHVQKVGQYTIAHWYICLDVLMKTEEDGMYVIKRRCEIFKDATERIYKIRKHGDITTNTTRQIIRTLYGAKPCTLKYINKTKIVTLEKWC